jgi:hypothetical protein
VLVLDIAGEDAWSHSGEVEVQAFDEGIKRAFVRRIRLIVAAG